MNKKLFGLYTLMIAAFLFCSISAGAQSLKASGTVNDDQGPLSGASVMIKGTSTGVTTGVDGNFAIDANVGDILVFTFIGYQNLELPANENITVTMKVEAQFLDDVVVVGYGVQKKSDVTGAISQVKSEDIQGRSITRAEQALQGKTAGVQVISASAAPGSSPSIRVRGISSNSSSVGPIYLVDGLQVSDIGYLDPNNIESMEVLKDAASAAIYGAQAGNGVILITTKSGKAGQGNITYDFQYVMQDLARTPKVMNASQYMDYMLEGNIISQEELDNLYDGHTDTDWTKVAFETSMMQRHNLSFQGGNERGSYFASLNYLTNNGIVKGDKDVYNRLSAQINADYRIKNWLKIGTTNSIEKWDSQSVSESNEYGSLLCAVLSMDPLTPDIYEADDLPLFMLNNKNNPEWIASYNDYLRDENGDYYGVSQLISSEQVHPMIMRDATTSKSWGLNMLGTFYADFTPVKGLTITSKLGYRAGYSNSKSFGDLYYANSQVNRKDNITLSRSSSNNLYYQWENYANYLLMKGNHSFNAMLGISFSQTRSDSASAGTNKLTKNLPQFQDIGYSDATATKSIGGGYGESGKMSYFGRVSYSYGNRYLIQAVLRRDAFDSSVLSSSNRWGTFPSVSLGWIASNEKFLKGNPTISYLKLRTSWGQNGNIGPLGGFKYQTSISSSYSYPYTNDLTYNVGSAPSGLSNPNLKWETSEQFDIGLDLRMFHDKLTFTFDYYTKETKDLLVSTTPPYETGVTSTTVNAGNVHNHGLEFELGYRATWGKDFHFSANANLATVHNEVTYLDPSISRISGGSYHTINGVTAFEVGYPVWYFRGYQVDHIDAATGDPVFKDISGDGAVSDDDKTFIGSAIPDFTYGITLNAEWKGIDLTLFGTGSQGNDIFSLLNRVDRPRGNKLSIYYTDRWTKENTNASRPRPACNGEDKYWISDAAVFDGSYFKIKQIQLGYTLPSNWTRKIMIQSLRLYVSLDDWFCFTSYPGMDPEAASANSTAMMGMDKGAYPTAKKTMFGLSVTF